MKRLTLSILIACFAFTLSAQNIQNEKSQNAAEDSLLFHSEPEVDGILDGQSIFSILSSSNYVSISQPSSLKSAMSDHIASNGERKVNSYRVRIFFDNNQNARNRSMSIAEQFSAMYPGIPVYRNHVAPYFKVTVGNFRTRDEAQQFASRLNGQFSSVFLVKESVHYPSL